MLGQADYLSDSAYPRVLVDGAVGAGGRFAARVGRGFPLGKAKTEAQTQNNNSSKQAAVSCSIYPMV